MTKTLKRSRESSGGDGDAEPSRKKAATEELSYEDKLKFTSIIAKPMASKKLAKKVRSVAQLACEGALALADFDNVPDDDFDSGSAILYLRYSLYTNSSFSSRTPLN